MGLVLLFRATSVADRNLYIPFTLITSLLSNVNHVPEYTCIICANIPLPCRIAIPGDEIWSGGNSRAE